MTSFGCKISRQQGWNLNLRIQGQVCHLIDPVEPNSQQSAHFLQIYFMDFNMDQVHRRLSIIDFPLRQPLRQTLLLQIQTVLEDYNRYVKELKHVYEITKGCQQISNFKIVIREDARPPVEHARRYNAPTASEVAVLMPIDPVGHRDIVPIQRDNILRRISELCPVYDSIQYPLLFSPRSLKG